jgi:M6 family metalloprotease-like protein
MPTRPTPIRLAVGVLAVALAAFAVVLPPIAPPVLAASGIAAPASCVLPSDGSMGAIDWDLFRRPVGTLRAAMLFVDFPDAPATASAENLADQFAPQASAWLAQSSLGRLRLEITPVRHWLRMPEPLGAFQRVNGALELEAAKRYIAEAVAAADPEVDFSGIQLVMIIPDAEATAYPRSSAGIYDPDEAPIADGHVLRAIVTLGSSVYERGFSVLAHETTHLFGPRDYYNAFGSPTAKYAGSWSLMADPIAGGDNFALDKWRMGWLSDSQVRCSLAPGRAEYVLSPVETRGGVKLLVIRTGLRTAVTVEYRTRQGLDAGLCSTGVLIAKVNSALKGGAGPIRVSDARPRSGRPPGRCSGELDDAAFRTGGRWTDTTSGLAIDVLATGSGARIRVTRTSTYTPPTPYARTLTPTVTADTTGAVTVSAVLAAAGGLSACTVNRPVTLQQWQFGEWWTLRTLPTDAAGAWTYTFTPTPGATYRLIAPDRYSFTYDCLPATTQITTT